MNVQQQMYFDLYQKCLEISDRIDSNLLVSFDELDAELRKTLLVDNNIVDNDLFYGVEENVNNIYDELKKYEQV